MTKRGGTWQDRTVMKKWNGIWRTVALAAAILGATGTAGAEEAPPCPGAEALRAEFAEETRRLAGLMATADQVVVTRPWGPLPGDEVYETADPGEIAEFNGLFRFEAHEMPGVMHLCAGHPEVAWRREGETVARVSIGHGESVRWEGFGYWVGDAPLAEESRGRLAGWFLRRGIPVAEEWHLDGDAAAAAADRPWPRKREWEEFCEAWWKDVSAEDFPVPETTPFDGEAFDEEPGLREAYRAGYRRGVETAVAALHGEREAAGDWEWPEAVAGALRGLYDGHGAVGEFRLRRAREGLDRFLATPAARGDGRK